MKIAAIRVHTNTVNPLFGDWYTLMPETTIEQFENLGIGELPFTYSHVRSRVGHCYVCDRPIWTGQATVLDEEWYEEHHEGCHWEHQASKEFERNLYKPRYVVAVYDCDREMGGREEGGWSYETGNLVCSVEVNSEEAAELIRTGLEIEYPYTGKRGYYSKQEPDFSVFIMDRHEPEVYSDHMDERLDPVRVYPVYAPHYE